MVATWQDIPGQSLHTGNVVPDWPTLVAVGEVTRYVGDTVALVAAESRTRAAEALALIDAKYEVLEPVRSPEAALAAGAPELHPGGNVLSRLHVKRGDVQKALAGAAHVVTARFETPPTDHAFMEPESALAYPPDADGVVLVRTGEQNVYDGRKYIADTLGLPREKVRVVSAYVGGGFGGKEDQTVQHTAALLAWLSHRPVKCTLGRAESTRVHVKRHAMSIDLQLGCDAKGKLTGLTARIIADTGAYASLGGPVLHRAVTHAGGPYAYPAIDVEGVAVFTNNPPAGAFRGFGVPQVNFAMESALDLLAVKGRSLRLGDPLPECGAARGRASQRPGGGTGHGARGVPPRGEREIRDRRGTGRAGLRFQEHRSGHGASRYRPMHDRVRLRPCRGEDGRRLHRAGDCDGPDTDRLRNAWRGP